MKRPPITITMRFCSTCGRDDRFRPFLGKAHYVAGKRCPGTPRVHTYVHRIDAL